MTRLNTALVHRAIAARFVTLFYAQLDPDGTLTFCNGGHNPPFLVDGRGEVRRLEVGGTPMGLFDGLPFAEQSVKMEPGDLVVLFSDGVSEAFDPDGAEFEDARILESIASAPSREAPAQLEHLLSRVKAFTREAPQSDDVTVLVVAYRGETSNSQRRSIAPIIPRTPTSPSPAWWGPVVSNEHYVCKADPAACKRVLLVRGREPSASVAAETRYN